MRTLTLPALLAIMSFSLVGCGLNMPPAPTPTEQTSTLNLDYTYGVGAKNELDTFHGTYTKDMIVDPSTTIPFVLTDAEREGVHQKIDDLNLFASASVPKVDLTIMVTPCSSHKLTVEENGETHEVSWGCEQGTSPQLEEFADYLEAIIASKDAYKALPEPQGGYL